jgi:hypothetical protein
MRGLAGQVEDDLPSLHQMGQAVRVAHVGDVDPYLVLDPRDVLAIAAIGRNQAVDDHHVGAQRDQPVGEIRADEAEPAGDHHPPPRPIRSNHGPVPILPVRCS